MDLPTIFGASYTGSTSALGADRPSSILGAPTKYVSTFSSENRTAEGVGKPRSVSRVGSDSEPRGSRYYREWVSKETPASEPYSFSFFGPEAKSEARELLGAPTHSTRYY